MFMNYLKIALRQLKGNLLYSLINITGLAVGLACCLLILLYVRFEQSYESGFANADRIYRVSREYFPNEGARLRVPASVNAPVMPALQADHPQIVERFGRIFGGSTQVTVDELSFTEPDLRFADQDILQIFDFELVTGDATTALLEPNSVVLGESLALKYFGSTEVLGRTLQALGQLDLRVTGVFRDLPGNTHLSVSGLISLSSITKAFGPGFLEQWNSNTDFHSYLLLRDNASIESLLADIPSFLDRHIGEGASTASTLRLMNIRDIHLRSDRDEEWQPHGSQGRVTSFAAIAFAILVIACINFMSIATARASTRAREVGMRKALGSSRQALVLLFLGEALLFTAIAVVMAVALVELLLPAFSVFAGMRLSLGMLAGSGFILVALGLAVGVTLVAGAWPAFFLSGFQSARVFKGEVDRGRQGLLFRNVLVVFQFAIAITMLVCTLVIHLQRELATGIDLGFDKDGIVVVGSANPRGFQADWPAFKQELLTHSAVESVTSSHYLPFGFNDNQIPVQREGGTATRIQYMLVDFDFFTTYGIDLVAGRDFAVERGSDTGLIAAEKVPLSFIANEAAAAALGIDVGTGSGSSLALMDGAMRGTLVGIARDTLFESIRSPARPLLFILVPPQEEQSFQIFRNAAIKVTAGAEAAALAHLDATWQRLYPNQPLQQRFLEEDFQAQYQAELKQEQLFSWFSVLAVLIACFGLFGLATFNAERRRKEIGVRKVMGGSVWSIVLLLTNDFSKLVLIANVIAWPLAWVAMQRWLEQFAYRIDLTPLIFIGSGLIALCVAWVTVGGTAAKAASRKPVLALRYE